VNFYFDTSALIKLFHVEEGTDAVTSLVRGAGNRIWLLDLARIEYASALFRRFRNREIDESSLNEALAGFDEQCSAFQVEAVSPALVQEAGRLLREHGKTHGLRTLDALHLAGFCLVMEANWIFVTADDTQAAVGRLLGWRVVNPLKTSGSQ
jgi:uncharacterized protein